MTEEKPPFHIVALGASAGGLDALERFFKNVSTEPGMAFIVVPHLDPDHASLMPELLQKTTDMPVRQIEDGMTVHPDHIYIVPPDRDLGILNRELQLMKRASGAGPRMPIDYFFRALASDAGEYAAGIVLSGMGMDGSLGLRAIKGELGLTMAKDPESAKYDAMPRNAIDTEQVDFVLAPAKMPGQLLDYIRHRERNGGKPESPVESRPDDIQKVFFLLRQQTGHDFSAYKKNTIHRRIERRMNVHQLEKLSDYVQFLQKNPHEINVLFRELLIGVTSFFRDAEAFDELKKHVAAMLKEKPRGYTIRAWVPGCASGEEAYSIAMILYECIEELKKHAFIQMFATDIDEQAIEKAREGVYPASVADDVGPERLNKFFVKEESVFRIRPDIREMIVFAPQNIIKDPPFTKLDVVCCRNLLIYMESSLQKKLLPLFHYSLNPGGILFLGSSESVGEFTDLLEPHDKKWKIFKRKDTGPHTHPVVEFPLTAKADKTKSGVNPTAENAGITKLAENELMSAWVPPSAVVSEKGEILYIHGRTGKYLEPSPGEASFNIYEMAREGLKIELPAAIRKAANIQQTVIYRGLTVRTNGESVRIVLTVKPLDSSKTAQKILMVSFEEMPPKLPEAADQANGKTEQSPGERVGELEEELQHTKESLQTTIEELETSNEELKSTNEELQSTNEELQSTNEELETSKEEQQSLNEELSTVNSELQEKISELTQTNNDMKNLLDSIDIPVIFLDNVLRIKRFTQQAGRVINLIEHDIGRPISDISTKIETVNLHQMASAVLKNLVFREKEIRATDGRWYAMRVAPYRTIENVIDGVVITFSEITRLKKAQQASRLATILKSANDAVIVWNLDGRILTWNQGAESMYGYTGAEAKKKNLMDLVPADKQSETHQFIEALKAGRAVTSFKTQRQTKDGRVLDVWLTVTRVPGTEGRTTEIVTTERDLNWLREEGEIAE